MINQSSDLRKVPEKQTGEGYAEFFPSDTHSDGKISANNLRTGAAQGAGSFKRKAHCRICGFPADLQKVDHSGGSADGNGAGGAITSTTDGSGDNADRNIEQAYKKNAGCPLCFSKNSSRVRILSVPNITPHPKTGF